ncbi:MFS transporter [Chloroflexota bacterium]
MTERKTKISYAWRILLICFILMFLGHIAHASFFKHVISMIRAFDWSFSNWGWSNIILGFLGYIAGLISAPFIDRFGPRRFMLIGFPLLGIGFIVLSFVNAGWMLYIAGALVGLGFGIGLSFAPHTVIAHWFEKRRCFALALLLAGPVLGKILIEEPVTRDVITSANWNWTALGIGLIVLVICVPLTLMIRNKSEHHIRSTEQKMEVDADEPSSDNTIPAGTDFSAREVLKSKPFWFLTIAMALAIFATMPLEAIDAAFLIAENDILHSSIFDTFRFAPYFSLVGILLFGYLGDKYPKRYLLITAMAIQIISVVLLMTVGSIAQLYVYHLVFGIGSGIMPLLFAIRADYFGLKHFATIAAIMILFSSIVGWALSYGYIILINQVFDVWENFQLSFIISIIISIIVMVIYFFARPPKTKKTD